MNQPLPPSPAAGSSVPPQDASSPRTKRRWLRWVLVGVFLLAMLIVFLPNILALPFFRQTFLNLAFSRVNTRATVGGLSLSWFSPISMSDLKLQPENTDRAA